MNIFVVLSDDAAVSQPQNAGIITTKDFHFPSRSQKQNKILWA